MSPATKRKACDRQSDSKSMACAKVGPSIELGRPSRF